MDKIVYIEGEMFNKFLKKTFNPFYKEVCDLINKFCKKVDECLGINRKTGNTELVLNQRGQWVSPPVASEVTKWEYIEIPYTLFTANATTETVTFYTVQPKQTLMSVVLQTKEVFDNTSTFVITEIKVPVGANQLNPSPNLNCKTILNTASIGNNGNLRVPNLSTTSELQITAVSTGGNVNAPTQGKINCWILTSTLP